MCILVDYVHGMIADELLPVLPTSCRALVELRRHYEKNFKYSGKV